MSDLDDTRADLDATREPEPPGIPVWHSALLALVILGVYLGLGQTGFYKADGPGFVLKLERGDWSHYAHFLYLPILHLLKAVLGPFGLTDYRIACVGSALGSALGVFALHRASARLGLGWLDALLVVLLVAFAPSIVFFATVVEVHGVFFGFVGLAWWAAVRLLERPGWRTAVALGSATALASFVHSTGHLLLVALFPWLLARHLVKGARPGPMLGCLAVTALVHAAYAVALPIVLSWFGLRAPVSDVVAYTTTFFANPPGLGVVPKTVFLDWLVPFLPISVMWFLAVFERGHRRETLGFGLSLIVYLGVTSVLIRGLGEQGAYLAPLAFVAALLTLAAFRRPMLAGLVALAIVVSVVSVIENDRPKGDARYAADLSTAVDIEHSYLILGTADEIDPVLRAGLKLDFFLITDSLELLANVKSDEQRSSLLAAFDAALDAKVAEGRSIYLTDGALRILHEDSSVTRELDEHLETRYRLVPVEHGTFRASRLERVR